MPSDNSFQHIEMPQIDEIVTFVDQPFEITPARQPPAAV
jgi:hypothetical protein